MRVLFTFAGGAGHLEPLLPLARAARAAGHAVAVAGMPRMAPVVAARGFPALPVGPPAPPAPPRRIPLQPVDPEREDRVLRDRIAGALAAERADRLLEVCRGWRPDVVVADEVDYGAMVAAERLGVPHAAVAVLAAGGFARPELLADRLDELRAAHGLPPDPGLAMPGRHLYLVPFAPSFRDPAAPLPATAHPFDPWVLPPDPPVTWTPPPGEGPLVYLTLGTVFHLEAGDLFARALAGLRELGVRVVGTVGAEIDPAELGPQPATVHLARHLPQAAVLPHCAAVVCHGGSGSVTGALAHGLPVLCLAMGADQPHNARRVVALGAGVALDPVTATPAAVRDAVAHLLADPAVRAAAAAHAAEVAALPGPASAVPLLERLAAAPR